MLYQKPEQNLSDLHSHGTHIANNTLVLIRWVALLGQFSAVMIAFFIFDISFNFKAVMAVLALSAIINTVIMLKYHREQLTIGKALVSFCYDIVQLAFMLFLTGGLQNPFSVMLLAPLTVGASRLPVAETSILTSLTLICSVLLYYYSVPLIWPENAPTFPHLFLVGQWVAVAVTILFMAGFVWKTASESRKMSAALMSTKEALMAQQKMSALGAQAAAAAHELGSPLSTIAIIVQDLQNEFGNDEELQEDIGLLSSQTERCRSILADLSRNYEAPTEEITPPLNSEALIKLIAEPYLSEHRNIQLVFEYEDGFAADKQPLFHKTPELSHGFGNILQNAIQFAKAAVTIKIDDTQDSFTITFQDDGKGFSPSVLNKIGEPYISSRKGTDGHMGLGIFIAKALLEQTGADITAKNRKDQSGAEIQVRWPRLAIENLDQRS